MFYFVNWDSIVVIRLCDPSNNVSDYGVLNDVFSMKKDNLTTLWFLFEEAIDFVKQCHLICELIELDFAMTIPNLLMLVDRNHNKGNYNDNLMRTIPCWSRSPNCCNPNCHVHVNVHRNKQLKRLTNWKNFTWVVFHYDGKARDQSCNLMKLDVSIAVLWMSVVVITFNVWSIEWNKFTDKPICINCMFSPPELAES